MKSIFLLLGALSAMLGVAMGAFGAHGLKALLTPQMLAVYKTAVDYQMWHALGLVLIAMLQLHRPSAKLLRWAGWLMFAGILLFSGSLYLLAITNARWLGMITPFGGLAFLSAWLLLVLFAAQQRTGEES